MIQLLNRALNEIQNLDSGEEFLVRDLFKGYEWNRLDLNSRRNLGRFFFEPSQNPYLEDGTIIALDKNKANQQLYRKI